MECVVIELIFNIQKVRKSSSRFNFEILIVGNVVIKDTVRDCKNRNLKKTN